MLRTHGNKPRSDRKLRPSQLPTEPDRNYGGQAPEQSATLSEAESLSRQQAFFSAFQLPDVRAVVTTSEPQFFLRIDAERDARRCGSGETTAVSGITLCPHDSPLPDSLKQLGGYVRRVI